jgi:hypothetical protein
MQVSYSSERDLRCSRDTRHYGVGAALALLTTDLESETHHAEALTMVAVGATLSMCSNTP